MRLKRVGVWSVARVLGAMYATLGLLIGIVVASISLLGMGFAASHRDAEGAAVPAVAGVVFGVGAIVIAPVFYGVLGLIGGALMAALYNLYAKLVGGFELELE